MRLDEPVRPPLDHVVQVVRLVSEHIALVPLDGAPGNEGQRVSERQREFEVITSIVVTAHEVNVVVGAIRKP